MQIITSKRRITVEHATARDEKLLDMGTYGCVAVVVNQTFNAAGLLFEYTQSRHQPDYFCFFRTLPRGKVMTVCLFSRNDRIDVICKTGRLCKMTPA